MRIGALFAGYSGLDMGVQSVLGGELAWVSEIDRGACKILAHRYPDVPNLGDITAVDWSSVEPVDVLTGGSPCQDLSHAGRRAGMSEGTRSNLWVAMREAIAQLRPKLVIWENVRGAYSASADSELETRPGLLGSVRRRDGEPVLRALGRVLGDLSDLGYDAQWHGLRAADVGAPHGRFRVFLVAHAQRGGRDGWAPDALRGSLGGAAAAGSSEVAGEGLTLLPTPAVNDMGAAYTPETWDEWTAKMQAAHGNGNGHGKSLSIEAQRLLPTPQSSDPASRSEESAAVREAAFHGTIDLITAVNRSGERWGDYAAAIARWETVLGRPAPAPTMTSAKGNPQLSPAFVEWMMGLPAGWVTDTPGITRNEALRALGNGVCPPQCAAALRLMLGQAVAPPAAGADRLLPTPERSDGSGGRVSAERGGKRPSGAKRAVTLATAVDHTAGEQCGCLGWDQPHRKGRGSCIYAPGLVDDGETDA